MEICLGRNPKTGKSVWLDSEELKTHLHMIGATGTGKSTAIITLLRSLMLRTHSEQSCIFLIDPMGGLSRDMLTLMAHPRLSTQGVRDRLVYIEPSNEDVVTPLNPLLHTSEGTRHYQVVRAIELILRGFDAQDLRTQPRLYRWLFNAFYSAAEIGIPISLCRFILQPGTQEHSAILSRIHPELRYEWEQVLQSSRASLEQLDSTRNRLQPFFKSPNLRRMFGCVQSRFDCERFIKERKIVILNLAKQGRLTGPDGQTIGALALNEIFETAFRLAATEGPQVVDPTYVVVDEFQKYVGPDLVDTIPTSRQVGVRCLLAHQSYSQLEKAECDLTDLIAQARTRLIFNNSGADADIVAEEIAKHVYNPKEIQDKRHSVRQLITGYRKEWLENYSSGTTNNRGNSASVNESLHRKPTWLENLQSGKGSDDRMNQGQSISHGMSDSQNEGRTQANVPIHKTFRELVGITYKDLNAQIADFYKQIRHLKTGQAFFKRRDSSEIPLIQIDAVPIVQTPELRDGVEELKVRNFESDFFITAAEADREQDEIVRGLLNYHEPPRTPPNIEGQGSRSSAFEF